MGCDRQRKMWRGWAVVSIVGVAAAMGPAATAEEMVTVQIVVKGGPGADDVICIDLDNGGLILVRYAAAEKSGAECYEFETFDGAMLYMDLRNKHGKEMPRIPFPLIHDGRQKKLLFSRTDFTASLNGQVVFVNLADPKAVDWVRRQPAGKLKSVRTIRLSGKADTDRVALDRLAASGVLVVVPAGFFENIKPAVLAALVAAKPVGVVPDRDVECASIPAELDSVRYLSLTGAKLSDVKPLAKLKYLQVAFPAGKGDLKPLAGLTQLKFLVLGACKGGTDFRPVARIKNLRSLALIDCHEMKDVTWLQDNRGLQMLTLTKCGKLTDLTGLAKLQTLRYLSIKPVAASADLEPLKKLKKLKVLIVDSSSLKMRKAEYDELGKALPDTEIIGFCMGSAWILAVAGAALAGGILWRRRTAPQ